MISLKGGIRAQEVRTREGSMKFSFNMISGTWMLILASLVISVSSIFISNNDFLVKLLYSISTSMFVCVYIFAALFIYTVLSADKVVVVFSTAVVLLWLALMSYQYISGDSSYISGIYDVIFLSAVVAMAIVNFLAAKLLSEKEKQMLIESSGFWGAVLYLFFVPVGVFFLSSRINKVT